ncbi:MAG: hypothetical protein H0W49_16375 [Nitrospirales bacterium]|nr:hypothetical protein [Nitrospirales bacterium]
MKEPEKDKKTEDGSDKSYLYRHAGIREREGGIPLWLMLVCIGLIVWSVYYTIRYWSES